MIPYPPSLPHTHILLGFNNLFLLSLLASCFLGQWDMCTYNHNLYLLHSGFDLESIASIKFVVIIKSKREKNFHLGKRKAS
ncbi:hypothetical protein QBC35DRAFT_481383 [Podospora australis]|uniref:Uncharacterized protein n=1 Tax=Podospora australis TaxID=1536484 RepID=A0AAN6X3G3_9PEZI|nr:hypothetical protein QBC35DRAFT_481383 [Podospora australis]